MRITNFDIQIGWLLYREIEGAIGDTERRLIKAGLATPPVQKYLAGVPVVLCGRMKSRLGVARISPAMPAKSMAGGGERVSDDCIHLNARRLSDHQDLVLDVIVHEVAHLLAYNLHGDRGHGPAWKKLMAQLGCKAQRCLQIDPGGIWRLHVSRY